MCASWPSICLLWRNVYLDAFTHFLVEEICWGDESRLGINMHMDYMLLGKIKGTRKKVKGTRKEKNWQRMRWLDDNTDAMDMNSWASQEVMN